LSDSETTSGESCRRQSRYADWRQGDFALCDGAKFFLHLGFNASPTDEALHSCDSGSVVPLLKTIKGLAVVSQSCDVVRDIATYEFVEVAPLMEVEAAELDNIKSRKKPRYVFIPGAGSSNLVADLGRAMTVEKRLLETWIRHPGCISDEDQLELAERFAARRMQFAFPDDFIKDVFSKCRDFIKAKAKADSQDGRALHKIDDIRVLALPDWGAERIELHFYFFVANATDVENEAIRSIVEKCVSKLRATSRFVGFSHQILTTADLRADEYLASARLDLDQASVI